jgi:hypothetical protein
LSARSEPDSTAGARPFRGWVNARRPEIAAPALPRANPTEHRRALLLAAKVDHAWRLATSAMVCGNWTAAAQWEERRVISEDELARLRLERSFGRQPQDHC